MGKKRSLFVVKDLKYKQNPQKIGRSGKQEYAFRIALFHEFVEDCQRLEVTIGFR